MTPLYFSGLASDLGHVTALPQSSFAALCEEVFAHPTALALTRSALHALPEKEQNSAKRTNYITAATFKSSPSPRQAPHALVCNLIPLDVDDSEEAARLISEGFDAIKDFGHVVWHTARSTPDKPRLRIVVRADELPLARFDAASCTLLSKLGLTKVVVFNPVQPMYLPVQYSGEEKNPLIASNPQGDAFNVNDIDPNVATPVTTEEDEDVVGDLDYLRTPMEGVTIEDAESALSVISPDVNMADWIAIAMGLKHQFGEDGYALWDAWSAKGEKYVDADETAYRWSTLKGQTTDRNPVTIRTLFKKATALGWENSKLSKRLLASFVSWVSSPTRSTEELLDQAAQRIAKHASALSALERKTALVATRDALTVREMKLSVSDINREVQKFEAEHRATKGPLPWAKDLCYITSTHTFFNPLTGRSFTPEVLDLMHGNIPIGEEKTMPARSYVITTVGCEQVEAQRYEPEQGKRLYFREDGVPYVNIYRPSYVESNPARANEAGDQYQEHLANLIAESAYQKLYLSWQAYLVQKPGKKILWAPLLQGCEGCGKSFTAFAMIPVLGRGNVRKINANDVMTGQYNDWAYGQQLVVMEEVRIVGANRHAVMDKLKPCISDESIGLHRKFEHHQTVKNTSNYLMFTNHHDSLSVTAEGRRYFVLSSPLQLPEQVQALGGKAYFDRLFGMVRDNAGGLRSFFENYSLSPDFDPTGRAPKTRYLQELADAAASPLYAAVAEVIADEPHPLVRKDLLAIGVLRQHLDARPSLSAFSDQALAGVLREQSWVKSLRVNLEGVRHQLWTKGRPDMDVLRTAATRMELL